MNDPLEPVSTGRHRHLADPTANGCMHCAIEVEVLRAVLVWLTNDDDERDCLTCAQTLSGCDFGHVRSPQGIERTLVRLINARKHLI